MTRFRFLLLAAALCACPASAKSPITHEQMWKMKRVGAPVVSPDGRWAVFTLTNPAYDSKDASTDLWLMPADGSAPPRQITFTRGGESSPAWSPDSNCIVFTARREGDDESQLYLLNVTGGGEAERLTSLTTGAANPAWSPDGTRLAFMSRVYRGAPDDEANRKAAADRKARKYKAHVYEGFPVRYWDHWLDDREPHLFVLDLATRTPRDLFAGSRFIAAPGFDGVSATSGSEVTGVWTPDGSALLFTATQNRNASAYANVLMHLWQVPASGGEPKLVAGGDFNFADPQFSGDGNRLFAVREVENDGKIYHLSRLVSAAWSPATGAGAFQPVAPGFDRSVNQYTFSPDGRTLYLTAEEAGHEKIFTLPAAGGDARLLMPVTEGVFTGVTVAGSPQRPLVLALFNSSRQPGEIVAVEGNSRRALTHFNDAAVADIQWHPAREFWFTSAKGRKIHNTLVLPPDFDPGKKYPLVVFIHGGPHTMTRDEFHQRWNFNLMAAPGYAILMTNYTGSTGFGEEFAQMIQKDPLATPGAEVEQAVDEALKQFPFLDAARLAAGGASYGGHLANWLQGTSTRFRCLYSHAGLINLESQWGTSDVIYHRELGNGGPVWEQGPVWRQQNPIRLAAKFQTPMLLTVGENDFRVPLNQTLENWSVLQRRRIPSKLIVFPEENHWILKGEDNRFFYQEWHGWLARWLGSRAPGTSAGR
ncbi:MAG: S9 family peptidase [Acidobacteria bacterium]|nr:S9 family peptidase [Acidobacteriota bacterium]